MQAYHPGQGTSAKLPVACVPLQSLLDMMGMQDVDLFSLDVEGAELAVLQTIDLSITNMHVVLVEQTGQNKKKDEGVRQLLKSHGFVPAPFNMRDGCLPGADCAANEAFINPHFEARRAARLAAPVVAGTPSSQLGRVTYQWASGQRC